MSLSLGSTNAISQFVLPPVILAHSYRLRQHPDWSRVRVNIDIEERNYPDLIGGIVNSSKYRYAVGWELSGNLHPDIAIEPLADMPVGFRAVIGEWAIRDAGCDNPLSALAQKKFGGTGEECVSLEEFKNALAGKTVAVVKFESDTDLKALAESFGVNNKVLVDLYDGVLSCIASGRAAGGWVPEFYPERSLTRSCRLLLGGDKAAPPNCVSHNIAIYKIRNIMRDESWEARAADRLIDSIKRFYSNEGYPAAGPRLGENVLRGRAVDDEAIWAWAKGQPAWPADQGVPSE